MKTTTLATTTLSFLFLGLTAISACGDSGGSDEVSETTDPSDTGTGDESGTGTGDGDGDGDSTTTGDGDTTTDTTTEETDEGPGELPNGAACTDDSECMSLNCYVVPFLGGQCGECNEDADCARTTMGGCTPPNPFEANGSTCNMGEAGGGCESTDVCMEGLVCGNVLSLLGLIELNTCGECEDDAGCADGLICAPVVEVMDFSGINTCIPPNSLAQDSFCNLEGNGDEACMSGICSIVDIMGLAEIGSCGECASDADCMGGTCMFGEFNLDTASLSGSVCI